MRHRSAQCRTRYPVINGKHSVELKLRTPHQLFDERDPAPFREKDLDDDAARYIHGSFRDLRNQGQAMLALYFEDLGEFRNRPQVIMDAIHVFFQFEADVKRRELRDIFRQGVISLLIGLTFLFLCTWLAQGVSSSTGLAPMLKEGLAIMGWVAMWRPISIFLYEWWPIREAMRTLEQIAQIEIEILADNANQISRPRREHTRRSNRAIKSWHRETSTV